jgi:hypothetical protein
MATSTIPAVKANLVAGLTARAALSDVQVSYGPPLPNPSREMIWRRERPAGLAGDEREGGAIQPRGDHQRHP